MKFIVSEIYRSSLLLNRLDQHTVIAFMWAL